MSIGSKFQVWLKETKRKQTQGLIKDKAFIKWVESLGHKVGTEQGNVNFCENCGCIGLVQYGLNTYAEDTLIFFPERRCWNCYES